jgi:sec-independent protein translocase protein TatA
MGWDAPWHWVIVALIVIALFGYKKLPDAARSLGRSLRIFKTEIKGMTEDDKVREAARDAAPATPATDAVPVVPVAVPPKTLEQSPASQASGQSELAGQPPTPVTTPASNGGKPTEA